MESILKKIISQAIYAPSGENCQPWAFKIINNSLIINNLPERDQSLYSWGQRASMFAHGTLIENISILADQEGFGTNTELFPENLGPNVVAKITLIEGGKKDDLASYVRVRCTNRKLYKTRPLSETEKHRLTIKNPNVKLTLFEDLGTIEQVAHLASTNERIIFENKYLHDFFFNHINWNKEEDKKKSIGFYIETLELPPPAKIMFKLARYRKAIVILNKIGFSKMVAKENSKVYKSASAIGFLTVPQNTKENFLQAGRAMQRLWLTATELNLSIQPLTGLVYLALNILAKEHSKFSENQKNLIDESYRDLLSIQGDSSKTITMIFRIGESDPPTARSSRLEPIIKYE
jgi:hypothetical protein